MKCGLAAVAFRGQFSYRQCRCRRGRCGSASKPPHGRDFPGRTHCGDLGANAWQNNWQHFAERTRQLAADESGLRQRIWNKLKREAANIPFVEDALTAHYCAFDRNTPLYVKLALVGAVAYFLVPDDLIPDSIPVLGVADDAAVLAGAMKDICRTYQAGTSAGREADAGANAARVTHGF